MSRTPLRQALNALLAEGLVRHTPNVGYFVVRLSAAELAEVYLVREVLEEQLLRTVDFGRLDMAVIKALAGEVENAMERQDVHEATRLNRDFHFAIFAASDLSIVRRFVAGAWSMSEGYRSIYVAEPTARERVAQERAARDGPGGPGSGRGDRRRQRAPQRRAGHRQRIHREGITVSDIEFSVDEHVATILLNRRAKKNAFTTEMIDEWTRFLVSLRADRRVRAVVLTSAGGAFCSGADLGDLAGEVTPLGRKRHLTDHIHRIAYALEDLEQPVIAAVEGPAVGAGMDMALMCDLRVISETARFCEAYVKVGLVPGDGGCYFLPRLVGIARALELLWTGRFVEADEALRIGLANRLVQAGQALTEARALAAQLAAAPPVAIGMIKRATYQSARADMRTALNLVSSDMGIVRTTEDSKQALQSFKERRPADYQGR